MIIEDSFSLIRTNPLLTTNVKIVVSSDKKVFLDSIISNPILNDSKYKGVIVKEKIPYEKALQKFWESTPPEYVFEPLYDNDSSIMYTDYKRQYDDIYFSGASKVINNNTYQEEFEYFAPLYLHKDKFPESFIIFRVDGSGVSDTFSNSNFKSEILSKMKVVKNIDLLDDSFLGNFNKNSFVSNDNIPLSGLDISVNDIEFTRWKGIGIDDGVYLYKSKFINNTFSKECTYKEVDALLTNGFRENGVAYPNILNFSYLFNDTPATKDYLRKWSINRYYGFYGEKKVYKKFTFYKPYRFITNFEDTNVNIILNIDSDNCFVNSLTGEYINPFYKYKSTNTYYVEYLGEYYFVKNVQDNKFKIISDIKLTGKIELLNKTIFNIDSDNVLSLDLDYYNAINVGKTNDVITPETDIYNVLNVNDFNSADVWIVEIDGMYHRLIYTTDNKFQILSDYGFSCSQNILKYWINVSDPAYTTTLDLEKINETNKPISCTIYKYKFNEIKDFDYDILDTKSTDYEYMLESDIVFTQEPKIYKEKLSSETYPNGEDLYIYNNDTVNIPCGSEYTASGEIFEVIKDKKTNFDDINELWRKNSQIIKWGYINSISHNDYSYRFNMSSNHGAFNLTTDITKNIPIRSSKNLDYFYNINYQLESFTDIINQSLSITRYDVDSDTILLDFDFDVNTYFNSLDTDYFTNFFAYTEFLKNGEISRKVKKYTLFCEGDSSQTNHTLFKGIKFSIYNVSSNVNGELSLERTNAFDDYKFSVLLAPKSHDIDTNFTLIENDSIFKPISVWEEGANYKTNDFVLYNWDNTNGEKVQHLYKVLVDITNASVPPSPPNIHNCLNSFYSDVTLLTELEVGNAGTFFYNSQLEYTTSGINYTYYKGEFYKLITTIPSSPTTVGLYSPLNSLYWEKVNLYQKNVDYASTDYFVYLGNLCKIGSNNEILTVASLYLNTTSVPNKTIFMHNNVMYVSMTEGFLDSGIAFYINKKHKNILLHLYINDNTVKIKNINRDDMYNLLYNNLTANNIIGNINNLSSNGFTNTTKYYILDTDGSLTITDNTNLKYLVKCEIPNQISVRHNSLRIESLTVEKNLIQVNNTLSFNEIKDISQLNWYDGSPLAVRFYNKFDNDFYTYYRYNGYYCPIFKNVELFLDNDKYLFDTNLTFFGQSSEIVISKVGDKNVFDNVKYTAIYPQVDAIGYSVIKQYIFNSSWSNNFYKKYSK